LISPASTRNLRLRPASSLSAVSSAFCIKENSNVSRSSLVFQNPCRTAPTPVPTRPTRANNNGDANHKPAPPRDASLSTIGRAPSCEPEADRHWSYVEDESNPRHFGPLSPGTSFWCLVLGRAACQRRSPPADAHSPSGL